MSLSSYEWVKNFDDALKRAVDEKSEEQMRQLADIFHKQRVKMDDLVERAKGV